MSDLLSAADASSGEKVFGPVVVAPTQDQYLSEPPVDHSTASKLVFVVPDGLSKPNRFGLPAIV